MRILCNHLCNQKRGIVSTVRRSRTRKKGEGEEEKEDEEEGGGGGRRRRRRCHAIDNAGDLAPRLL